MIVIPRDDDNLPIMPCFFCKHRYVEDIWFEDMCDKVKDRTEIINCKYFESDGDEDVRSRV